MGELVPYIPHMQQDQGYNTYPGQLCVANAVTAETSNEPGNPFQREYRFEPLEEYEKLAKCLKISAGAAVSRWGLSGWINISFLDRSEFENSTFTYQDEVVVPHQRSVSDKQSFNTIKTNSPIKTYGDRFTADFVLSSHFFVRVSITARGSSQTQQLKQSTEVAFYGYGVEGKVTQEDEGTIEGIRKNSQAHITIHESTGISSDSYATCTKSKTTDLLTVREKPDIFVADASSGKRNYLLFAFLGKLGNLSNFEDNSIPLDYSEASNRSCADLGNFTMDQAIENPIKAMPANKFKGGSSQSNNLSNKAIDNSTPIGDRILSVSEHPDEACKPTKGDENWIEIATTVNDSTTSESAHPTSMGGGKRATFGHSQIWSRASPSG